MADHVDSGIRKILDASEVYVMYQSLIYPQKQRLRYFSQYIQPFEGAKILDIGCGPGITVHFLNKLIRQYDYIGFDFNQKYIDDANKRYGQYGKFICSRVEDYELDISNQFDIVIANAVLHHLNNKEATALYKTAYNALKPGGRLVTFDCVWVKNQHPVSKALISYDRGQHVRTEEALSQLSKQVFDKTQFYIDPNFMRVPYDIIVGVYEK